MMNLTDTTIKGLAASGPDPELKEKLDLFGQFVGDWDILEDRFFNEDGSEEVLNGELHWRWILDGRAVQDVWMFEDKATNKITPGGTTIRFYDPQIEAWKSTWISPIQGVVETFIGRKLGEEIVLESKNKNGNPIKWIFSDIERNSFTWRGEESDDDGRTWKLKEKMIIKRR